MNTAMAYRVSQVNRPAYLFLLGKSQYYITSLSFCPYSLKIYGRLTKNYHVSPSLQYLRPYTYFSMTSLLMQHTVAHSTRPSFRLKINKQPFYQSFMSCGQMSKSCQKWQNSDFQSQFSMSKIIRIFLIFFFH
jgi:hypothetical protein